MQGGSRATRAPRGIPDPPLQLLEPWAQGGVGQGWGRAGRSEGQEEHTQSHYTCSSTGSWHPWKQSPGLLTYSTPSASKTPFYNQTLKGELGFQAHDFVQYPRKQAQNKHRKFWLAEFFVEGISWGETRHCACSEGHEKHGELWALDTGRAVHALLPDINPTRAPTWLPHLCPPSLPALPAHSHLPHTFTFLDYGLTPWHDPKFCTAAPWQPFSPSCPQHPFPDAHKGAARSNRSRVPWRKWAFYQFHFPSPPPLQTNSSQLLSSCGYKYVSVKKPKQSTQKTPNLVK